MWVMIAQGIGGILSLVFAYLWYASEKNVTAIESTETTRIGDIAGEGYHEVKGIVRCRSPLTAPRCNDEVVYYHLEVTQRYRETYRDDTGEVQTRTSSRTIQDDAKWCKFSIEDESGDIHVVPNGAQFHGFLVHSRDYSGNSLGGTFMASSGEEVLQTLERVRAIPVDKEIYALGFTREGEEGLILTVDSDKGRPFILSTQSKEELTATENSSATWYMILTFVSGLAALYPFLKHLR